MAEAQKSVQKMTLEAAQKFAGNVLVQWESPAAIRKVFAPNLSDEEFKHFMGMGLMLGASPFAKEIYAVKYGQEPASIIVARALYRRKAQEQPNYGGCVIEVVYPGEKFQPDPMFPDKLVHVLDYEARYAKSNDVIPYGAYFIGFYRDERKPIWHFCATKEYIKYVKDKKTGKTRPTKFWSSSPETMIKKVVDSQGHKLMYQGIFQGTLTEDEVEASAHKFEGDDVIEVEHTEVVEEDSLMDKIVKTKEKPTETKPEKGEPLTSQEQPSPDPASESVPPLSHDIGNADAEPPPDQEKGPDFQDDHDWPEWTLVPKETVQRKFRYLKNELFPKHTEGLKAVGIMNTLQLATKSFDVADFTPQFISPEQYEEAIAFIKSEGK